MISKRKRFIITSIVLSLGFIAIQLLENQYRIVAIGGLSLLTAVLFAWCLWEGLGIAFTLLTLVLPVLFTGSVGIFWFLLPASVYARLPIVIFYGVGVYVLALTSNIFTVSAIRTIALLRAARGVGFVLTLVTSFLIFDAALSLRAPIWLNIISIGVLSFVLFLQGLWTVILETDYRRDLFYMALVFSLIMAEVATSLYFWPVTVVVGSLFLTGAIYMLLGLGQARLEGRLFPQTVREYLVVGILVFIGMFFATRWG